MCSPGKLASTVARRSDRCPAPLRRVVRLCELMLLRSVPLEGLQFDVRRLEAALHEVELAHRFADDVERKRA